MRRLVKYLHELEGWPAFDWDAQKLAELLTDVRHRQGRILGRMEAMGFQLQSEAHLHTLTLDVLKSSEIEGEVLEPEQVRSSLAQRLGIDIGGMVARDRNVDGVVEMMLDATQNYKEHLTADRLHAWHGALFPTGRTGMRKIVVGAWRDNKDDDPMQVISGAIGKEKVHYEAPSSRLLKKEMKRFLKWFNEKSTTDPVIKAAIAHLWFVTIHPFDDGNGRIARAIADMQLARADETRQRFYSMSAQIRIERKAYYDILERTQKGNLDITGWLDWFLQCLKRALIATDTTLAAVLFKAKFWEQNSKERFSERQKLMLNKMLDGFDGKLTSSKWAKITKTSSDTAVRDINDLVERNILEKEGAGGRSTSYVLKGQ